MTKHRCAGKKGPEKGGGETLERLQLEDGLYKRARLGNLYKEYLDLGHGVHLMREYGMDGNTLTYESVRPVMHLADLLGSTVATFDAQGNTIADRYYGAFGDEHQASGAPTPAPATALVLFDDDILRGYTGHHSLSESRLVHMGGRGYDAKLGRFLSADPAWQMPYSSQSWNRYSYALNSPYRFTDPTGYYQQDVHFWVTYYTALAVGYSTATAGRLAVYTQMPDADFRDAIMSITGRNGQFPSTTYQMRNHGLTFGSGEKLSAALFSELSGFALDTTDDDQMFFFGARLHLFGDSYSHRMRWFESRLYPPVVGHLFHWTSPDKPNPRPVLFEQFSASLYAVLDANALLVREQLAPTVSAADYMANMRTFASIDDDGLREQYIRGLVTDMLGSVKPEAAPKASGFTIEDRSDEFRYQLHGGYND